MVLPGRRGHCSRQQHSAVWPVAAGATAQRVAGCSDGVPLTSWPDYIAVSPPFESRGTVVLPVTPKAVLWAASALLKDKRACMPARGARSCLSHCARAARSVDTATNTAVAVTAAVAKRHRRDRCKTCASVAVHMGGLQMLQLSLMCPDTRRSIRS
jgi:hypothetical protein